MAKKKQALPLRDHVQRAIRAYLKDMGNTEPEHVYRKLLTEIEPPLIEEVLNFTLGNQSRAARILGMTRNTLRSKLRRYDIKSQKFPGLGK
ncbi:MAG: Fis family transcriptional regulator [Xanthomonadales bacterium]|nr:Fis family transcriptional regulator [Xanthomonadales bacterium]NIX14089.1 Fis family transcriptional regulator [Xanthomonadales bacterium]